MEKMKTKLHKIELYLVELADPAGIPACMELIDSALNNISMTTVVRGFNRKSVDLDWDDAHPLNLIDATQQQHEEYFEKEESLPTTDN